MLGSDLISYANYGHYMAHFAQNASNEVHSAEAQNKNALATTHTQQAPGAEPDNRRPVELSANSKHSSMEDELKDPTKKVGPDGKAITPEEEKEIEELEERDAEVKRHEQAHFQAGGKYASAPKYEYQTGPDGKRYAVGGSVDIDISDVPGDPQATLEKARIIKRAALAPEDPSVQDRKVAREADQMAARAQREISEGRSGKTSDAIQGSSTPFEKEPAKSLEEIAAQGVAKVETDSLEINLGEHFGSEMVHRFRTSRLQMNNAAASQTETLASPAQAMHFRGQGLTFDSYI